MVGYLVAARAAVSRLLIEPMAVTYLAVFTDCFKLPPLQRLALPPCIGNFISIQRLINLSWRKARCAIPTLARSPR